MATYAQITRCITDQIGQIAGTGSRAYGEWVSMGDADRNHYAGRVFSDAGTHPCPVDVEGINRIELRIAHDIAVAWCARHEEISNG
jgi:hypothetical protein